MPSGVDSRSSHFTDCGLFAVAVGVLLVAVWPDAEPRREVRFQGGSAGCLSASDCREPERLYSLRVGDPRLVELEKKLAEQRRREPVTQIAIARWRSGVADHYASISPPDQAATWNRVSHEAGSYLERLRTETDRYRAAAVRGAVVVGPPSRGTTPWDAFASAACLMPITFLVASFWRRHTLPIRLESPTADPVSQGRWAESDWSGDSTLVMVLPRRWVRVHQPIGVVLRRWAFAAVPVAAFLSLFA